MSVHDPRATLRQIQDAARRLQMKVLWNAVQKDVPALLVTVEQMLKDLDSGEKA